MTRSQIPILMLYVPPALGTPALAEPLGGTISVGYECVYVDAGVEVAGPSLQPAVEMGYADLVAGFWANLPIDDEEGIPDEHNYYAAYPFGLTDVLELCLGATFYYFPQDFADPEHTAEANLALAADLLFSPVLGYDYDFDLEQHKLTLAGEQVFALADSFELVVAVTAGWVETEDLNTDAPGRPGDAYDAYAFAEGIVDLAWHLTDALTVAGGPRLAVNNNGDANHLGREEHAWWGVMASADF